MSGEIWLMRHGQASLGAADYDQLSELGFRQAARAGQALAERGVRIDRLVTGSMRRHRQTAAACLAALGGEVEPEVEPGWNEYDHEAVLVAHRPDFADKDHMNAVLNRDGDPATPFDRIFFAAVDRWVGGEHDADYPEAFDTFRARVDDALARLEASAREGGTVLVCTSGGVVASVCARLLGVPDDRVFRLVRALANASLCRLARTPAGLRLVSFNETAHLEGQPGMLTRV